MYSSKSDKDCVFLGTTVTMGDQGKLLKMSSLLINNQMILIDKQQQFLTELVLANILV